MVAVIPENTSIETFVLLIFAGSIILIILMGPIYLFKLSFKLYKNNKNEIYNITLKQLMQLWFSVLIFLPVITIKELRVLVVPSMFLRVLNSEPNYQEMDQVAGINALAIIYFSTIIILIFYTIGWKKHNKNKTPPNQEILK